LYPDEIPKWIRYILVIVTIFFAVWFLSLLGIDGAMIDRFFESLRADRSFDNLP
tara:strand:- start:546 stop:707 length:162 start_codon:yes stop_codon:yes gene_type:complete